MASLPYHAISFLAIWRAAIGLLEGGVEGVSKVNQRGLKAQKHIAQGSVLGIMVNIINNAPCKGNTLIIRLLPLQGV